jgi:PPK2 family polyphosphate:nucleotide phosphotransferase
LTPIGSLRPKKAISMKLDDISTRAPKEWDKEATKAQTAKLVEQIGDYQRILYAQAKYSLLIILQGVDASGKDGTVSTVFKGINPLGCTVKAFKKPTEEEMAHDFLWRVHHHTPARGMVQIFNRSHYEDVIVPSIEGWLPKAKLKARYEMINVFEQMLAHHDTQILKFYLHISPGEQKERLTERLTNPEKYWKHNDADWQTNQKWEQYREVYETIFANCNQIPWHIIPADQNWYKEHLVAKKIVDTLAQLDLQYPALVR